MKKSILSILALAWMATAYSQTASINEAEKCNKQKKTAWTLFGVGAAVATAGFMITEIDGTGDNAVLGENFDVGAWAFFTGIASCVASVPFFFSAHSHCKKNRKISLQMKSIQTPSNFGHAYKRIPALSLKLRLP